MDVRKLVTGVDIGVYGRLITYWMRISLKLEVYAYQIGVADFDPGGPDYSPCDEEMACQFHFSISVHQYGHPGVALVYA